MHAPAFALDAASASVASLLAFSVDVQLTPAVHASLSQMDDCGTPAHPPVTDKPSPQPAGADVLFVHPTANAQPISEAANKTCEILDRTILLASSREADTPPTTYDNALRSSALHS